MKNYIKIIAPILLGFFFIYLTFEITTPEERALIWSYIKSAKIEFIIAAMMFGAFADVIRGFRWRFLAKATGHSSNLLISIASVFMCYSSNLIITRSGEILRATVLSSYNNIPLGKTFGTIAAERVIDMMISFIILVLIWMLQYEVIVESFFDDNFLFFIEDNISYIVGLAITIVLLLSAIIPIELIFPAFVVSVFSISFSNHGLGVYPLAISLFLLEFNINTEIGLAYGWLAWSCQAIITLIFGGLSFFVLPLFNSSDRNG